MQEQTRGLELPLAESLLHGRARGEVAFMYGDDRVLQHEDADLHLAHHTRRRLLERVEDDEVVVVVLVDLRPFVPLLRILDGERMKIQLLRREREVFALRIADVEPARAVAELGEVLRRTLTGLSGFFDEQTRRHQLEATAACARVHGSKREA